MRALIDTNVIIDVLQKREPFFENSMHVVMMCATGELEGWITAKSLTDIYYLMHRHYHDNGPCRDVIRKLYRLFHVADTTAEECLRAAESPVSDYEDAVMDETAQALKLDVIATRNTKDFNRATTRVMTPKECYGAWQRTQS